MIDTERVTSYQVWNEIINNHIQDFTYSETELLVFPEIIKVRSHRKPGDQYKPYLPEFRCYDYAEDFLEFLTELSQEEVKDKPDRKLLIGDSFYGINAIVGIGKDEAAPHVHYNFLRLDAERELTFLFIDFDLPFSEENTGVIIQSLREMGICGYLLRSDFSYHFVSPELSTLEALPTRYGNFINAFVGEDPQWEWAKEIGNALIEAKDREEVGKVCHWILENVGHYEDHCENEGVLWFPVDLRYIAHSLLEYPTLRISSKEGYDYPPYKIEEFEGRREKGLESVGNIIEEGNVFCWMEPPAPKSA